MSLCACAFFLLLLLLLLLLWHSARVCGPLPRYVVPLDPNLSFLHWLVIAFWDAGYVFSIFVYMPQSCFHACSVAFRLLLYLLHSQSSCAPSVALFVSAFDVLISLRLSWHQMLLTLTWDVYHGHSSCCALELLQFLFLLPFLLTCLLLSFSSRCLVFVS